MKIKQFGLLGLLVSAGIVFADDFEPVLDTIPEVDEGSVQDNNPVDHEPRINDGVVDRVEKNTDDFEQVAGGGHVTGVVTGRQPLQITLATTPIVEGVHTSAVTSAAVLELRTILNLHIDHFKNSYVIDYRKKILNLFVKPTFKNFPTDPVLEKRFFLLRQNFKIFLKKTPIKLSNWKTYNDEIKVFYEKFEELGNAVDRYNNNQALDAFFKQPLLTLIMKKSPWWSFSKNPYSKQRLQLQNLRDQLLTDPNQFVKIMKQMDNVVDQVKALRTKDANAFLLKASKQGNVRITQDQIDSFVNGEITLKELKALNTQSVVANAEPKQLTNQLKAVVQQQKADTDLVNEYMQLTNQKQILTDQQQDTLQSILAKLEPVVNGLGDTAPEALKQLLTNAQNVQKVQMFELYTSTNTNVQKQLYFSSESLDIPKAQQVLLEAQAVLKKISDQTQKSILDALIAKLVTKIKNAETAQGAKTDVAEAV